MSGEDLGPEENIVRYVKGRYVDEYGVFDGRAYRLREPGKRDGIVSQPTCAARECRESAARKVAQGDSHEAGEEREARGDERGRDHQRLAKIFPLVRIVSEPQGITRSLI